MNVFILIPAFNPDMALVTLVEIIKKMDIGSIVIVNDGSDPEFLHIFEMIQNNFGIAVVNHSDNTGKGHALKSGFNHILQNHQGITGIITCDADGQHTPESICRVVSQLIQTPFSLVIGSRDFAGRVPFRSRIGNTITSYLFGILTGRKLSDTQSGLRGVPIGLAKSLVNVPGERFEFETNMLIEAVKWGIDIVEIKADTVYLNNNRNSHFAPVRDSVKIYASVLRYATATFAPRIVNAIIIALSPGLTFINLIFSKTFQQIKKNL